MSKVIAIGALGGSGTRAVAQVLIDAGIYMGDDLNEPNDNVIFTRLFVNPEYYKQASDASIAERLEIYQEYMQTDHLSVGHAIKLVHYSYNNPLWRENKYLYKNIVTNAMRKVLDRQIQRKVWGWKEPNTQVYIEHLIKHFEQFKYIHVLRHGLDMAFSSNKQQLKNWGFKYDLTLRGDESEDELAYCQLEYWVRSTKDAVSKAGKIGDNFLVLNRKNRLTG